jgi:hypothetical protein
MSQIITICDICENEEAYANVRGQDVCTHCTVPVGDCAYQPCAELKTNQPLWAVEEVGTQTLRFCSSNCRHRWLEEQICWLDQVGTIDVADEYKRLHIPDPLDSDFRDWGDADWLIDFAEHASLAEAKKARAEAKEAKLAPHWMVEHQQSELDADGMPVETVRLAVAQDQYGNIGTGPDRAKAMTELAHQQKMRVRSKSEHLKKYRTWVAPKDKVRKSKKKVLDTSADNILRNAKEWVTKYGKATARKYCDQRINKPGSSPEYQKLFKDVRDAVDAM